MADTPWRDAARKEQARLAIAAARRAIVEGMTRRQQREADQKPAG